MQLLCSCHIAALTRRDSLCSLCTFLLGNWKTQWHLRETSVLATTIFHWTLSSMSKSSCSGGLTNPAGMGRIASLDWLAVLSAAQLRVDTLGFVSKACFCLSRPPSPVFNFSSFQFVDSFSYTVIHSLLPMFALYLQDSSLNTSVSPVHLHHHVSCNLLP